MQTNIVLLGNPGKGKSTLLNGLIGETKFNTGVSVFSGMTNQLERFEANGVVYLDSPGLADADQEMCVKAAQAVTEALKQTGRYKIFFVVTLEAGRFDPKDTTLVQQILNHAPDISQYGVIINKMSSTAMDTFDRETFKTQWAGHGLDQLPDDMFYIEHLTSLHDQENVLPPVEVREKLQHWVDAFQGVVVHPEKVETIQPIQQQQAQAEQIVANLNTAQQQLQDQVANLEVQVQAIQVQQQRPPRPPSPPRRRAPIPNAVHKIGRKIKKW